MALRNQSLLLYNFSVDPSNSSLDFKNAPGGPVIMATLRLGFYSLSTLLDEIVRAMQSADPDNEYFVTADRTIGGGLQNRETISTAGTHLDLLFGTGPRIATSIAPYIGFNNLDYTGALTYTGAFSAGVTLMPDYVGYNYLGPEFQPKNFGVVNVSTSGLKEAIVFALQNFIEVSYKLEPQSKWIAQWNPFLQWIIQQREFDFTPDYTDPNTFYSVTLEESEADGSGLAFKGTEMLPDFPFYYETGMMKFRIQPS